MKKEVYVIKLGSNVLLDEAGINENIIDNVSSQVKILNDRNIHVVIVSSGAVAMGKKKVGLSLIKGLSTIEGRQVFSSIGQPALMDIYAKIFLRLGMVVSQALLTRRDFSERDRYISMKNVLLRSLELGVVPIINENDVLSQEELDFSDNDELSALIAAMLGASKLIILSSIDGLYDKFPGGNLIKNVSKIDNSTFGMVGKEKSSLGIGGMESKLKTAKLVMDLGIKMYLANGNNPGVIESIGNGENPGTLFESYSEKKVDSLRKWLKAGAVPNGKILVSNIISDLLKIGKRSSLLEIGIEKIEKEFKKGDVISVCDIGGQCIGYGIAKIDSSEINKSRENETKIVIHTDYFINI